MKHLFGLFVIFVIGFTSCEGRITSNQALSESIEEFRKNANLEVNVFIPETYVEKEVDTVLSNGYRVHIKIITDFENSVRFSKIKDTVNYQTHYRNYKFQISVNKNNKLIYNESFNKTRVNKDFNYINHIEASSSLYNFDKLAVLKSIQVNEDPSLKNMVGIDILFAIPESDRYAAHTLFIDENGSSHMTQVEIN